MKIIIAGYGFVGKAVFNTFKEKHDTVIVDPKYTTAEIHHHLDADGIIVCVNAPTRANGILDVEDLFSVLDQVPSHIPVLIKTTLTPGVADAIEKSFAELKITFNPEFLRQATANEDFLNQTYTVFGGKDNYFWGTLFAKILPKCNYMISCTAKEACLVKYSSNSFLALKTSFFNQIFDICDKEGIDYEVVQHILSADNRIGAGHTQVPGPDGLRGWGGHCFPKDTQAFTQWASTIGAPITLVESSIQYNKKVRK
jgi:UDPglucose 6-dehydrogenase